MDHQQARFPFSAQDGARLVSGQAHKDHDHTPWKAQVAAIRNAAVRSAGVTSELNSADSLQPGGSEETRQQSRDATAMPPWIRVRIGATVPEWLEDLVHEYVILLSLVFRHDPPRAAVIRTNFEGSALSIRFRVCPQAPTLEREALEMMASRIGEVARRRVETRESWRSKLDTTERGATPEACHKAETPVAIADQFDFDEYIETALPSTIRRAKVAVFKWGSIEQLDQSASARDADFARRTAQTINRLIDSGSERAFAMPPIDWSGRLDSLESSMPNFAVAIRTVVRPHVALCSLGVVNRMPPLLLVGPPGIGKTMFAVALADAIGAPPPLVVAMAAETNSAALTGSSTFWSNSSPGRLFESLAWGHRGVQPVANPIVVLDEIDKRGSGHYDPTAALYTLLEEETARTYIDQSLPDVLIDASHTRIVATCNDASVLPDALLSRMVVLKIDPPTSAELADIVRGIHTALITQMSVAVSTLLPASVVERATRLSTRSIRIRLVSCIGLALISARHEVTLDDWDLVSQSAEQTARPMGFVPR